MNAARKVTTKVGTARIGPVNMLTMKANPSGTEKPKRPLAEVSWRRRPAPPHTIAFTRGSAAAVPYERSALPAELRRRGFSF
jgi:hypothetical protein